MYVQRCSIPPRMISDQALSIESELHWIRRALAKRIYCRWCEKYHDFLMNATLVLCCSSIFESRRRHLQFLFVSVFLWYDDRHQRPSTSVCHLFMSRYFSVDCVGRNISLIAIRHTVHSHSKVAQSRSLSFISLATSTPIFSQSVHDDNNTSFIVPSLSLTSHTPVTVKAMNE